MSENMGGGLEGASVTDLQKAQEKKRERVDALRIGDTKSEDSVRDLAMAEKSMRSAMGSLTRKDAKLDEKNAAFDTASDSVLEAMEDTQEAKKMGWTDGLTGLLNRNAFNREIPRQISIERIALQNVSFLMIDFDYFKKVNDEYGHIAGDQALQQLAGILKRAVRSMDTVYRYGGEEFVVMLPNTDSVVALALAERIRQRVEETPLQVEGKVIKKTVSIGCTGTDQLSEWEARQISDEAERRHEPSLTEEEASVYMKKLIERADSAMYKAKNMGRNRVMAFSADLENQKI